MMAKGLRSPLEAEKLWEAMACEKEEVKVIKDDRMIPCEREDREGLILLGNGACNSKKFYALTSLHNGSPYVHATGITSFNTSISTNTQLLTSMTLISPSLYRETIARNQTYHNQ
jgi:hypothetical protein